MLLSAISAALAVSLILGQTPPQDPGQTTELDDVVVTAREREDLARTFVGRVAAPSRGRGLGRWLTICPGIANLNREVAQPIVDRLAQRAADLGIGIQDPGCEANIIVVFTVDAGALTRALVEAEPRVFRGQGGGIDRGGAALRDFVANDRPVRWWNLSVPIDSETGDRAVRVPGDRAGGQMGSKLAQTLGCRPPYNDCVGAGAPIIRSAGGASRLNSQIVDQLYKSIIIVDIDAVSGLTAGQLGDYLAMVSLAQIDDTADVDRFDTILNLFEDRTGVQGMTEWDQSYLTALYTSSSPRRSADAQAVAVAAIMNRQTEASD